jgi:hypothetical protein
MTTSRTLLTVVLIGGSSAVAAIGCAGSFTSGSNGNIPSAAQYAAIADDACAGVPAKERELGLLAYRDAITSVAPLDEDRFVGKIKVRDTKGAIIGLRATPGISVPWLERVNGCHIAMAGSGRLAGNDAAMDPFILTGTTVVATEVYAGYVLSVKGASVDSVQEILQRSYALVATPGGTKTASLDSR